MRGKEGGLGVMVEGACHRVSAEPHLVRARVSA